MKLKSYVGIAILTLAMTGCSIKDKEENLDTSNQNSLNQSVEKNDEDNKYQELLELADKFRESSYSSEENLKERSMEESIDYVKSIIPNDSKEIENVYEKEVGVNQVIYEYEGQKIEVRYMHPYKEDGNNVDEYDLNKTVGIYIGFL
ncbi:Uncharacterised protein [[Clostridium] sordellii]|uniref:Lipoprotein n=2 Tax=Paraclostridium sordellii TaxID=1505 RepID=A0ABM9RRD5_PARSO|nr:hypothetical protein [Paeniclostridium sordellii]EPZ59857.1 putative lipoprotein [[Clostridium] sordellii ATCC 9714] [Paeniclostridium sordellii ATCC 9714]CEJ74610.1 putative lipoprotein [[Clostridium] sordellii] [Paeniclostridium sordellii]CEN70184.1 Uncharacterised protein [[Clostridium] sordellii] [Paeniclostridium sordellii]CEN73474.1 Uncharacterised protein [[Clostridium] sordellii] [Paeniclostridium sordellii]CEO28031.1 Uncharacterised protein [[Clostridium] sordellii] [Paeniclostridi